MSEKLDLFKFDRVNMDPDNINGPYYGIDDGEGRTDWFNADGELDCSTETPGDRTEFQHRLQEYEKMDGVPDEQSCYGT